MNSIIKQTLAALIFIFADTSAITAKDYDIIVTSNPDNATVYLNGTLVSQTTPAVIKVDKKTASKMMIFSFRKTDTSLHRLPLPTPKTSLNIILRFIAT